jgi:hypothetical protein
MSVQRPVLMSRVSSQSTSAAANINMVSFRFVSDQRKIEGKNAAATPASTPARPPNNRRAIRKTNPATNAPSKQLSSFIASE